MNHIITILLIAISLFLIGCTTIGGGRVFNNYSWNDGPWLILKDNPASSITICWITGVKKNSFLVWGDSVSNLDKSLVSPGSRSHSVTINNLSPDTNYFYSIREDLTLYSEGTIFSFCTFPSRLEEKEVEFIIAGDLQPKNEYTLLINRIMAEQIARENPDFLIQIGDAVQVGSSWKSWHNLMKSLPIMASERPVLPVAGNHEYYFFNSNANFRSVFPYNFPDKKGSYYSVDIGKIHITFLDPYDGGLTILKSKISDEQKKWFTDDLSQAVSEGAEWIFVVLHQTILTNGEYPDDIQLRKWILPVLSDFDVDAVFWGHAHLYEHWRYKYGKNGYVINSDDRPGKNPIDYFCIGSSGASLESNYKLFSHRPFKQESHKWFNTESRSMEQISTIQYPWNREVFFEGRMGIDQFNETDRHYYHLPLDKPGGYSVDPEISYSTDNKWFGYMYGENTFHYAKLKVDESTCTISIHYPDGTILSGPDETLPQIFSLKRKDRSHLLN